MGINSGIYKFVLVLHILSAIVGFGAVLLNGIYGQQARARRGPEGLAITQANFLVSRIAQYFIYAVFVFGVLLVVLSDKAWSFSDNWITAAIVLYVLGIILSFLPFTIAGISGVQFCLALFVLVPIVYILPGRIDSYWSGKRQHEST